MDNENKHSKEMLEALRKVEDITTRYVKNNKEDVADMLGQRLGVKVKIKKEKGSLWKRLRDSRKG